MIAARDLESSRLSIHKSIHGYENEHLEQE